MRTSLRHVRAFGPALVILGAAWIYWSVADSVEANANGRGHRESTVREYLAAHHGARWSTLEAQIPEESLEILDMPVRQFALPTWAELKEEFRADVLQQVQSGREAMVAQLSQDTVQPEFWNPPLNPKQKPVSTEQLASLVAITDLHSIQLKEKAEAAFDLIVAADSRIWEQDLYNVSPILEIGVADSGSQSTLSIMRRYAKHNWIVSYTITPVHDPALGNILSEIERLKIERDHALAAAIDKL